MTCCGCESYDSQFDCQQAGKDLKRYRRKGPDKTTRLLLDALTAEGVEGMSLLDVGGGVGVVHHELLRAGAQTAVHVDAAAPYLRVAQEESARRGNAERVRFLHGDFVALAVEIPPADVVTLDRVICCYADMENLAALSAERARRLYGAVYPRQAWWVRLAFSASNVIRRLRRTSFRVYLHPPDAIGRVLGLHGLERRSTRRTLAWEIAVYARRQAAR